MELLMRAGKYKASGFTLLELIVVISIVSVLLTVVSISYSGRVDQAKEAVRLENVARMREAIDRFYTDRGKYPESFEDLVDKRYLRAVPVDPLTESSLTWVIVSPKSGQLGAIADIETPADSRQAK